MFEQKEIPIQPLEKPILCNPYDEPDDHWIYNKETGIPGHGWGRRPAGYWYKTVATGTAQTSLFAEEQHDELVLVNRLRDDVRRWRESGYRGASKVTTDLLNHWHNLGKDKSSRRLFFCQREAAETIIYLAELRIPGKSSRTRFQNFEVSDEDLKKLLKGERPDFHELVGDLVPALIDKSSDESLIQLRRLACKMATGSGKTVVMAMLIAWAFCNRGENPQSKEFPNAVLVVCPNLTVKERLQVLRPENSQNYFKDFNIVPQKYRKHLQKGKVIVTNWHLFAPESEHKEGDQTYKVVNKGIETVEDFAKRILGELHGRMPIMVLNDEGHHCWRPAPEDEIVAENKEEKTLIEEEKRTATVWIEGLEKLNNSLRKDTPGISFCIDMSATPFFIKGSGYHEGRPFPWIVSDFGLVDAIECGIVKIPRLPVLDTTGKPDPKYFRLWENIRENLSASEFLPGKARRPKPDVIFRDAEGALEQIAGQWVERFKYIVDAKPGQEYIPPVFIIVCDNTDLAEVFYQSLSGEREEEIATLDDLDEIEDEENGEPKPKTKKTKKKKTITVYGQGRVFPEYFSNTENLRHTIRIDSKLLAEAESDDPRKSKSILGEEIRKIVSTVGKRGEPGEHVRCVVSVSMLTEGWDANNVTQILGVRAFGSQLLCEQVVGRGLRRMDYEPDPETGMLTEEYVDVYGIPFSVIPFKGRPVKQAQPIDKPKQHVRALEERRGFEIRFPVVEGYIFALKQDYLKCDVEKMEELILEPNIEPTATFIQPTIGYKEGSPQVQFGVVEYEKQDREAYYQQNHIQTIMFQIASVIVEQILEGNIKGEGAKARIKVLQSRHQLFPQVYGFVQDYINKKVKFMGCHKSELGLQRYVQKVTERMRDAIFPDDEKGEPPLLPVLNRYKPIGTSAEVDFKTTRSCIPTQRSHVNQVVLDTDTWEKIAVSHLDSCEAVEYYVRNDHMGLVIPYEYMKVEHVFEPDFIVRLKNGLSLLLEIKGYEPDQDKAKHQAAKKWKEAVNNWGKLGRWDFMVCREPNLLTDQLNELI